MSESADVSRLSPRTTGVKLTLMSGFAGIVAISFLHSGNMLSRLVPINLANQSVFSGKGEYTYAICEE